jgi:hypothetical protein
MGQSSKQPSETAMGELQYCLRMVMLFARAKGATRHRLASRGERFFVSHLVEWQPWYWADQQEEPALNRKNPLSLYCVHGCCRQFLSMPIRDAHTKGDTMPKKIFVTVMLVALLIAGCKHQASTSYSGQLASLVQKIDPAYTTFMKTKSDLQDAMKKGDVQKAQSLSMQLENGAKPELKDALKKALETEQGKKIPFTQTDGQEGFAVQSVTLAEVFDNGSSDLEVNFHVNVDLKSKDSKWQKITVKAVNAKGEVLAEEPAFNFFNLKTPSGENFYTANCPKSLGKLNGLDHIVISSASRS